MNKTVLSLMMVSFLAACATDPYTGESKVSKTAWGTGIGAVGGAATGGYMDVQARKLRQELLNTGVQVAQQGNQIYLIMPGNITFGTNEATIQAGFKPVLNSVAKVINEYNKTMVQVNGYTDSTGSNATNMALSERRANAVSNYLRLQGVNGNRIITEGFGPANPIASNATAAGREQNRRVEIVLINRAG